VRGPIDRLTHRLPRPWRIAVDWVVTIVGAVGIVLALKAWVVNPYRIPSSSMEPTFHCARTQPDCSARFSDRVLANRFKYHLTEPRRGDIVVFETTQQVRNACNAGGTFVKRIIGLPGETWEERNGFVYINGKRIEESYINPSRRDMETHEARRIPDDHYFLLGDNRQASCDSRKWGFLPRENLIGEVFAVYWPPNRITFSIGALVALGLVVGPVLPRRRRSGRGGRAPDGFRRRG
jgi:signal peptidase I